MRFDLAMFGLAVASVCCAACGGGSGPLACPMLCVPVRTVAYFSVTDPTSGGAVAGVTFSEGSFELPATRVSRIDFGPSPGPCDCYEVDVRAARAVVSVRAPGRRDASIAVDLGDPPAPAAQERCTCEASPPRSGMRIDVALPRD